MKKHYVYRITNTVLNKHYYGVRSTLRDPKTELGTFYFSSSKDKEFIKDQKSNPQNYKYKIVSIPESRQDAVALEIKLHDKFDVGVNESFYNRSKQTSVAWDTTGIPSTPMYGEDNPMFGRKHTEAAKEKIKEARKRQGSNVWNKGKTNVYSEKQKNQISQTLKNKVWVKNMDLLIHKNIYKHELNEYLENGWIRGMFKKSNKPAPIDVA